MKPLCLNIKYHTARQDVAEHIRLTEKVQLNVIDEEK